MKIIKTASGKNKIKISKKEWEGIGKKSGWIEHTSDNEVPIDEEDILGNDVPLREPIVSDDLLSFEDKEEFGRDIDRFVDQIIKKYNIDPSDLGRNYVDPTVGGDSANLLERLIKSFKK